MTYERRVEVVRIVERFPTGEVRRVVSEGLRWVDLDEEPPDGCQYLSISSDRPEAHEMNFRRKEQREEGEADA